MRGIMRSTRKASETATAKIQNFLDSAYVILVLHAKVYDFLESAYVIFVLQEFENSWDLRT